MEPEHPEGPAEVDNGTLFHILGPLEVGSAAHRIEITATRSRVVLAILLLERGRPVHMDRLINAVWDDQPPTTARGQIHICISALRRQLAALQMGECIHTRTSGYRIATEEGMVDADLFESLVLTAATDEKAGRLRDAADGLARALQLWRGPALCDVESAAVAAAAAGLMERRLTVFETYVNLELRLGNARQMLAPLAEFIAEYPMVEGLRAQQMRALSALGRRAEALQAYQAARKVLVDELGIDPGDELRELEQAVLSGELERPDVQPEPTVTLVAAEAPSTPSEAPSTPSDAPATSPEAPAEHPVSDLPRREPAPPRRHFARQPHANLAGFAGRVAELEAIAQELSRPGETGARVIAVTGMAGIGKSWLLTEATRAFTADGKRAVPVTAPEGAEVGDPGVWIRAVLDALEPPPATDRSSDPSSGSAEPDPYQRYQATLSRSSALFVLDDVPAAAQLAGMLSGAGRDCAFLIAGRCLPEGLPDDAMTMRLSGLSLAESTALMNRLTEGQAALETSATLALAERVGGHPAVLEALSARCREAGAWSALNELQQADTGTDFMDAIAAGGYDIRVALQNSIPTGDLRGAELLRRWPRSTPELPIWAVAQLLDRSVEVAVSTLNSLYECGLVEWVDGDEVDAKAALHPLALCLVVEEDETAVTHRRSNAARRRVLTSWLALLSRASQRNELEHPSATPPDRARSMSPAVVDAVVEDPQGWLEANRGYLEVAIGDAADVDDELCWQLGTRYLLTYGSDMDRRHADLAEIVRMAATRSGDRRGETAVLHASADVHLRQGETSRADAELSAAERLCAELDESGVQAVLALGRGDVAMVRRQLSAAHLHFTTALQLFQADGNRAGQLCAILRLARLSRSEHDAEAAQEWLNKAAELAISLDGGAEAVSEAAEIPEDTARSS